MIKLRRNGSIFEGVQMAYNRNRYLQKKYGISLKQYNSMLKRQKCRCAICGKHQDDAIRNFSVDHCHRTGIVRGLLCIYCNSRILKYLGDDIPRAKGLIKYLQKWIKVVEKKKCKRNKK